MFAGVHSMQGKVYFDPGEPTVAILTDQEARKRMEISCKGVEAIRSLKETQNCIETFRIVRSEAGGTYRYCGDWMITNITMLAEDQASISLLGVFPEWT